MSEPKFTPGPWKAVRYREDIYTWTIQGNDEFEERSLAFVGVGTPNLQRDEANMHLIARAPEMYAFLEKLVNQIEENGLMQYDAIHNGETWVLKEAKELLSKVRGESEVEK